jgi:hypothetical protein
MPQIIDEREFPSKTSKAVHTARLYDDGTSSCSCAGWRFKRPGQERDCRHTVTLRTGTVIKVVTTAEMARMLDRGELFEVVKMWKNGVTGDAMVSLRMKELQRWRGLTSEQREARLNAFERDMIREPKRTREPEQPAPARARVAFDEEV